MAEVRLDGRSFVVVDASVPGSADVDLSNPVGPEPVAMSRSSAQPDIDGWDLVSEEGR